MPRVPCVKSAAKSKATVRVPTGRTSRYFALFVSASRNRPSVRRSLKLARPINGFVDAVPDQLVSDR
jgi:hypothetical protein